MASVRDVIRNAALCLLSVGRRVETSKGWIRIPYYHHVEDGERKGFARQLEYLRRYGEFVAVDDAIEMLRASVPIDGRYFTVMFDDGFKSCVSNALPILEERHIPATFFVVTTMVGRTLSPDDPIAVEVFGHRGRDPLSFMTWEDCRTLARAGMMIGSHASNHTRLASLSAAAATSELRDSKIEIERELGKPCRHFCPPYGIPGRDFILDRDAEIARSLGYVSLATGLRGANRAGDSPFALKRDHLLANWGMHQLRYFFSA